MFSFFKAFLLDDQGRSYFRKPNGEADVQSYPRPIPTMFEGWQDMQVGYDRDMRTGVKRSFTLPLSILKYLKWLIRWIVFTKSTEETLYLLIQKLYPTLIAGQSYSMPYQYWYKAQIDLSNYKYGDDRDTITLKEGGTKKLVEANDDTEYEISIDTDPDVIPLFYDGIDLSETVTFFVPEIQDVQFDNHFLGIFFEAQEGKAAGIAVGDQLAQRIAGTYDYINSSNYLFITTQVINGIHLKGTVKFLALPGQSSYTLYLWRTSTNSATNIQEIFNLNAGQVYTIDFDLIINAQPNEKFFVNGQVNYSSPVGHLAMKYLQTEITLSLTSRAAAGYINCIDIETMGKRLSEKIGLASAQLNTDYLKQYTNLLLCSGDDVRRLTKTKAKFSLASFTDLVFTLCSGGRQVEGDVLVFDNWSRFFNADNPIELGEVIVKACYPATDLKGNVLKVGYREQNTDDVNGKFSFNNTTTHAAPSGVAKELSYIAPVITDPYVIELKSQNVEGKETTDSDIDSDVILFNTEPLVSDFVSLSFHDSHLIDVLNITDTNLFPIGKKFTVSSGGVSNGDYTVVAVSSLPNGLQIEVAENFFDAGAYAIITYAVRKLKRVVYDSISGVPLPDNLFNVESLTPQRILEESLRKWIDSIFWELQGKEITYVSADKNSGLVTEKNSAVIAENGTYTIGKDILFKPWYFELEARVPEDLVEVLENNLNRPFYFTWYGDSYKGFLIKAVASVSDSRSQSLKLLCTPDTDLTNLIQPKYG